VAKRDLQAAGRRARPGPADNIDGDGQADLARSRGPDRRSYVTQPTYPYWRERLNLPDFPHGAFGENLTITGLDESPPASAMCGRSPACRSRLSQPANLLEACPALAHGGYSRKGDRQRKIRLVSARSA